MYVLYVKLQLQCMHKAISFLYKIMHFYNQDHLENKTN